MPPTTKPSDSKRGGLRGSRKGDVGPSLAGLRILIIEDIGMVASALKSMLEELGCNVVGIAPRVAEAEKLAMNEQLDGVLLDLNLGGEYTFTVTDILDERNIPFIIMSGYDVEHLCPRLADKPQVPKPFDRAQLKKLMLSLFCRQELGGQPADTGAARAAGPQVLLLKTRGEYESAVCLGMTRFEQEYMGRGPKDVQAHLLDDLLVVRLRCMMTVAEQHLVETTPPEKGRDLVKQVRMQMMEGASKQIDSMIQIITGVKVQSMHHDISTRTGEKVVIFTLSEAPACREVNRKDR